MPYVHVNVSESEAAEIIYSAIGSLRQLSELWIEDTFIQPIILSRLLLAVKADVKFLAFNNLHCQVDISLMTVLQNNSFKNLHTLKFFTVWTLDECIPELKEMLCKCNCLQTLILYNNFISLDRFGTSSGTFVSL